MQDPAILSEGSVWTHVAFIVKNHGLRDTVKQASKQSKTSGHRAPEELWGIGLPKTAV